MAHNLRSSSAREVSPQPRHAQTPYACVLVLCGIVVAGLSVTPEAFNLLSVDHRQMLESEPKPTSQPHASATGKPTRCDLTSRKTQKAVPTVRPPSLEEIVNPTCSGQCEHAHLHDELWRTASLVKRFCSSIRSKHDSQPWWGEARCNCYFEQKWDESCKNISSPFGRFAASAMSIQTAAQYWADGNPNIRVNNNLPVIAVLLPVKSGRKSVQFMKQAAVFRIALNRIVSHLETGYEYWFFIGYDAGDRFFDRAKSREEMNQVFDEVVGAPARGLGITVVMKSLRFHNVLHKPGPMFNFLSAAALLAGADFLFRTNDDTELKSKFASDLVECLARMDPPFFGVCGPQNEEGKGNQAVLEHDFVHRTHALTFPTHYPAVFTDWYLDDWISLVYTPSNTAQVPTVTVFHHREEGTRYGISLAKSSYLMHEVRLGASFMHAFLSLYADRYRHHPASHVRRLQLASGCQHDLLLRRNHSMRFMLSPSVNLKPSAGDQAFLASLHRRFALRRESNLNASQVEVGAPPPAPAEVKPR